ncbi:hypothetical protein C5167_030930 [Papaver somniferum]|nr:hypothetical protein C5167_030930 [Papaver somniferum]
MFQGLSSLHQIKIPFSTSSSSFPSWGYHQTEDAWVNTSQILLPQWQQHSVTSSSSSSSSSSQGVGFANRNFTSQIVYEAQKSVGWFSDESDRGSKKNNGSLIVANFVEIIVVLHASIRLRADKSNIDSDHGQIFVRMGGNLWWVAIVCATFVGTFSKLTIYSVIFAATTKYEHEWGLPASVFNVQNMAIKMKVTNRNLRVMIKFIPTVI